MLTKERGIHNIRRAAEAAVTASHSSSGLGHRPFTAVTGVRTPYGTPFAGIAQLVEHDLAKVGVASSNLVSRSNLLREIKENQPSCWFFCAQNLESESYGTRSYAPRARRPDLISFPAPISLRR